MNQQLHHWPLEKFIEYARNPRKNDHAVDAVAAAIKEYGFRVPILAKSDGLVVDGHLRLKAAKKLGLAEVPVLLADDLTEAQVKAFRISVNKMADLAEWDDELLALELLDLKEFDFSLELTGLTKKEQSKLSKLNRSPEELDELPPPPKEITVKLGDLWQLGRHRLLCADCTIEANVERLMGGEEIDLVFADPPYGINEETDRAFASPTREAKGNVFPKIIGDDSIDTALSAFTICDSRSSVVCYWGGNYYAHKLPPSPCWLVWDKREEDNQRDMNSDCELAYIKHPNKKSVRIFRHLWKGMIKASEKGQGRVHPTQKPVALAKWCFDELSPESKSIFDPFLGSGTTLIACEELDRTCYGMEISPNYCQVIIDRWGKLTGEKAELIKNKTPLKTKFTEDEQSQKNRNY